MSELQFREAAATGYDRAVGHMTQRLIPPLLRAARLAPGMRVLDIATGTGIAAEAAAEAVGPSGQVVAADISPAMVERARERLGGLPNVSFAVEDGQSLSFADGGFDAVLCNVGLMYFPDPARGLAEFRRVLRPGGRAAVSVNTTPERSMINRVLVIIGRHRPSSAAEAARLFSLGDEGHLARCSRRRASRGPKPAPRPCASPSPHSAPTSAESSRARGTSGRSTWRCRRTSGAWCARRRAAMWATRAGRSR